MTTQERWIQHLQTCPGEWRADLDREGTCPRCGMLRGALPGPRVGYYARRENTAALTEADTRTLIAPEGSVAEAGWVKCKAAPPQTRETRLEAAGWKVTR